MTRQTAPSGGRWDENNSREFIDYGRYFVPDRERQIEIMVSLLSPPGRGKILELACGEGLLSEAILDEFPSAMVIGLDGSAEMRRRARSRLAHFGPRFKTEPFDLADRSWRRSHAPVYAVLSSLALHHLDGDGKQLLFHDVYQMLLPGGSFVIADLIETATEAGRNLAADAWDAAVKQRVGALDGNEEVFSHFERMRWNMYRYFDPDDIDKPSRLADQFAWLSAVGFTSIDLYYFRAGHAIFGGRKGP